MLNIFGSGKTESYRKFCKKFGRKYKTTNRQKLASGDEKILFKKSHPKIDKKQFHYATDIGDKLFFFLSLKSGDFQNVYPL
jgi:hypothetical protein